MATHRMRTIVAIIVVVIVIEVKGQQFDLVDFNKASKGQLSKTKSNEEKLRFSNYGITIEANRFFSFSFNPNQFLWSEGDYGGLFRSEYKYTPFLRDQADLPDWMKYKYSDRHKTGFLYGTPSGPESMEIDVVCLNKVSYEYGLLRLTINVTEGVQHEMSLCQLKIDNLNVEDMFDTHRVSNLLKIFKQTMWTEARDDIHLRSVASSVSAGFRRPLEPTLKDGVIVVLASKADFSKELKDLQLETSVLSKWNRFDCPRDFKRTSVEHIFRSKGFAMDWCGFELSKDKPVKMKKEKVEEEEEEERQKPRFPSKPSKISQDLLNSLNRFNMSVALPSLENLPVADWTYQYIMIFIPTLILGLVLILMALCLYFVRCPGTPILEHEDRKEALTQSFFLVLKDALSCYKGTEKQSFSAHVRADQDFHVTKGKGDVRSRRASSVHRQTDTLRRLAQNRNVTSRLLNQENPVVSVTANPNYDPTEPPSHLASGLLMAPNEGGPIILLSDDDQDYSRQSSPEGEDAPIKNYYHGSGVDPLGSLSRPRPPAYFNNPVGSYNQDESAGTYLV